MSFAPYSFKAGATISAYRIVKMSAADTVVIAGAATDKMMGVTVDESSQGNQNIPVAINGVAKIQFNDTCAVGGFVTSDASGLGVPVSVTTAGVYAIGQLIGPAVAATGTIADVLLMPQQLSIP